MARLGAVLEGLLERLIKLLGRMGWRRSCPAQATTTLGEFLMLIIANRPPKDYRSAGIMLDRSWKPGRKLQFTLTISLWWKDIQIEFGPRSWRKITKSERPPHFPKPGDIWSNGTKSYMLTQEKTWNEMRYFV